MAPRKQATKRSTTRKASAKNARKTAKKTTKKATKRTAKKSSKKATKKGASKAAAPRKSAKFSTRKAGVFTQTDLVDNIEAMNPDLSKSQARQVVNDVLDTLQTAIKKTDRVRLKGVGTITKKKIPARKGGKLVKNPFTGEMVKQKAKPASVKVKLNPAKELKEAK